MECRRTTFGQLKRGDRFALSESHLQDGEYLNMKVDPAVLCDYPFPGPKIPFNVVSLLDGRPRTFSDEEPIWIQDS